MSKGLFGQPESGDRVGLEVGDVVISTDPTAFGLDKFVPLNVPMYTPAHVDVLHDFGLEYVYNGDGTYTLTMTDNVTISPAKLYLKVK